MSEPKKHTPLNIAMQVLLAIFISTAMDHTLAAVKGYILRVDPLLLWGINALALAPMVLLAFFILGGIAKLFTRGASARASWTILLLAAWTPIGLVRLWKSHGLMGLFLQMLVIGTMSMIAVVETRKSTSRASGISMIFGFLISAAALGVSIFYPLVGRKMLHDPTDEGWSVASPENPNLIFVVLDTMRADHLSPYGYARDTTPWLNDFSKKSTLFEQVVSASSYTLPTHASFFTGLYPASHGADVAGESSAVSLEKLGLLEDKAPVRPLSHEATTLAEIAYDKGIETGAICANSAYLSRFFGMDQGFKTYVDAKGNERDSRPAGLVIAARLLYDHSWKFKRVLFSNERYYLLGSEINNLALKWLEPRKDHRFFLFLNYMEPHAPYLPVGKYRSLYPEAYAHQQYDPTLYSSERDIAQAELQPMIDAYDASTRSLDDRLNEFFALVDSWGLMDKTLIVFVADHGESFGEHRKLTHAKGIYQPEVHVPLIYRRPGQSQGSRVSRFVSGTDILPSVLDDMRLPRPDGLQGASLFDDKPARPIITELGRYERDYAEIAIYEEPLKLLRRTNGEIELYDIKSDPAELKNLAKDKPEEVKSLSAKLDEFQQKTQLRFKDEGGSMDDETVKRLKALGYL